MDFPIAHDGCSDVRELRVEHESKGVTTRTQDLAHQAQEVLVFSGNTAWWRGQLCRKPGLQAAAASRPRGPHACAEYRCVQHARRLGLVLRLPQNICKQTSAAQGCNSIKLDEYS